MRQQWFTESYVPMFRSVASHNCFLDTHDVVNNNNASIQCEYACEMQGSVDRKQRAQLPRHRSSVMTRKTSAFRPSEDGNPGSWRGNKSREQSRHKFQV